MIELPVFQAPILPANDFSFYDLGAIVLAVVLFAVGAIGITYARFFLVMRAQKRAAAALQPQTRGPLLPVLSPPLLLAADSPPAAPEESFIMTTYSPHFMRLAVERIPKKALLSAFTRNLPTSLLTVPAGIDHDLKQRWLDFGIDTLHVGIYGQTGAGKDVIMRGWFATLCERNTPEAVQFAILDYKGDWMTSHFKQLAHMWAKPAGGYGEKGNLAILLLAKRINAEAERRYKLIFEDADVRNREDYIKKTGKTLPLLFVIITDSMNGMSGEMETFVENIASRARALGIRLIVSMQTPTGKKMEWRMNLSTVLAGNLQDGSQDAPALGRREVSTLPYRPSALPAPKDRPGIFVMRQGNVFGLVQAPLIGDDEFNYRVNALPRKADALMLAPSDDALLLDDTSASETPDADELFSPVANEPPSQEPAGIVAVSLAEAAHIALRLAEGLSVSDVAKSLPGYRGALYGEYKAKIERVKTEMKQWDMAQMGA